MSFRLISSSSGGSGGSGYLALDNKTTFTAATTVSLNLNQTGTYIIWRGVLAGWAPTTTNGTLHLTFNGDSGANYFYLNTDVNSGAAAHGAQNNSANYIDLTDATALNTESGPNSWFMYDICLMSVNGVTMFEITGGFREVGGGNPSRKVGFSGMYTAATPTSMSIAASQTITGYLSMAGATQ